jgi:hypothetical protein
MRALSLKSDWAVGILEFLIHKDQTICWQWAWYRTWSQLQLVVHSAKVLHIDSMQDRLADLSPKSQHHQHLYEPHHIIRFPYPPSPLRCSSRLVLAVAGKVSPRNRVLEIVWLNPACQVSLQSLMSTSG